MTDYFGYDILYVLNITDIDDKIIKRARQNYLFDKYVAENHALEKLLEDAKQVMDKFINTVRNTTDPDKKQMLERILTK